jgi:hypothetical protein
MHSLLFFVACRERSMLNAPIKYAIRMIQNSSLISILRLRRTVMCVAEQILALIAEVTTD